MLESKSRSRLLTLTKPTCLQWLKRSGIPPGMARSSSTHGTTTISVRALRMPAKTRNLLVSPLSSTIYPLPTVGIELKWTAWCRHFCHTLSMTTKTIPEYLEDEHQKDCDAQLRMEEEAARIQPLNHGHHRIAKQPKLELPSVVKPTPKARETAAQARKEPRAARKAATKARNAA